MPVAVKRWHNFFNLYNVLFEASNLLDGRT